eukprot:1087637-Karenia_brevis.AAC.1
MPYTATEILLIIDAIMHALLKCSTTEACPNNKAEGQTKECHTSGAQLPPRNEHDELSALHAPISIIH